MARGDIDEFRNPAFDREMAYLAQQAASANQGSRLGGLASILMRGDRGWSMMQNEKSIRDVKGAYDVASTAKEWINPNTGKVAPGTTRQDVLKRELSGLADNTYAGRDLRRMLSQEFATETAAAAAEKVRQNKRKDAELMHQYKVNNPLNRGTYTDDDGLERYTDDGSKVNIHALGRSQKFQKFINPTVTPSAGPVSFSGSGALPSGPRVINASASGGGVTLPVSTSNGLRSGVQLAAGKPGLETEASEWQKLSPTIQQGILMSKDPMKTFSKFLLDREIAGTEPGWSKKVEGSIQEKLFNVREGLVRLNQIRQTFQSRFQQLPTRLAAAWGGTKSFLGMELSPEETKLVGDYSDHKQNSIENINLYIKELTGAQMSASEADRLRLAVADPGEKWWQGDNPIDFQRKMENSARKLKLAAARYTFALQQGWDMSVTGKVGTGNGPGEKLAARLSLGNVEAFINRRGDQIEKAYKVRNPKSDASSAEDFVRRQLAIEFGENI